MSEDAVKEHISSTGGTNTNVQTNARQRPDTSETKELDERGFQSALEFWKIKYDFYKHLMTIAIALVAGFGAMLGGVFNDSVVLTNMGHLSLILIITCFLTLLLTVAAATKAATWAGGVIQTLGQLQTHDEAQALGLVQTHDEGNTARNNYARSFYKTARATRALLAHSLFTFAVFAISFFMIRWDPTFPTLVFWTLWVIIVAMAIMQAIELYLELYYLLFQRR